MLHCTSSFVYLFSFLYAVAASEYLVERLIAAGSVLRENVFFMFESGGGGRKRR